VSGVATTINGLLSPFYDGPTVFSLALVIGGGVVLHRRDPVLSRMVVCLFAIPVAVAALAGIRSHVLLTRTLAPTLWAPLLCTAAVIEAVRRWRQPVTRDGIIALAAVIAVVAVVLVPSLPPTVGFEEDTGRAALQMAAVSGPGDAVAIDPAAIGHVLMWEFDAPIAGERLAGTDTRELWAWVRPGAPFSGRLWILTFPGYRWNGEDGPRCAGRPSIDTAEYTIRCFAVAVSAPR
jgi:hypothetical protein